MLKWLNRPTFETLLNKAVQQVSPPDPGTGDIRHRILFRIQHSSTEQTPDVFLRALDACVCLRWELALHQKRWPAEQLDYQDLLRGEIACIDRLLPQLVDVIAVRKPKHLSNFILPKGVPLDGIKDSLGPVINRVTVEATPGRQPPTLDGIIDEATHFGDLMNPAIACARATMLNPKETQESKRLIQALDVAVFQHWKNQDSTGKHSRELRRNHKLHRGALVFLNRVLPRLADAAAEIRPDYTQSYVLPPGIPADKFKEALGLARGRIHVVPASEVMVTPPV